MTTQAGQVRENIGLVGQYAAVDEILTARQNLVMFGQLNHLPAGRPIIEQTNCWNSLP